MNKETIKRLFVGFSDAVLSTLKAVARLVGAILKPAIGVGLLVAGWFGFVFVGVAGTVGAYRAAIRFVDWLLGGGL